MMGEGGIGLFVESEHHKFQDGGYLNLVHMNGRAEASTA